MPTEPMMTGVGDDNPTLAFNLASVVDWSTSLPFIDLAHMMRPWIGHLPGQWGGMSYEALRAGGYLDENGWVREIPPGLQSVGSYWAAQTESQDRRGTFVMTYDGEGTIQVSGNVTIISQAPGRIVFSNPTGGDFLFHITSTDPNNTDNYIRNISVVHENDLALHEAGALFNPDWLEVIGDARQLRFMDWMETNNSHVNSWDDLATADSYTWAGGVPVEIMVRLANEVGADPWFNMPHLATDEFVRQFAEYVRDNLDPGLTARVEFSNELWNGAFPQTQWLSQASQAAWGVNAPIDYHAMRATQVALIWEEVFAEAQGPVSNLVNVLGAFSHGPWYADSLLDPAVWRQRDPNGYTPPAEVFEELAIANYFGTGVVGDQQIRNELLTRIAASPTDAATWLAQRLMDPNFYTSIPHDQAVWAQNANVAHEFGLDLVAYEGGQHLHHSFAVSGLTQQQINTLTTFMANFVRSEAMGTLYNHLWDAWAAVSDGPMMQFQEVGSVSQWGSWGLLSHLDDSTPRSVALLERARTSDPWWDATASSAFQHGVQTVGTSAGETIAGTAQEDYLAGQGGNDILLGGLGEDGLSGGSGNDTLNGGGGADFLRGGVGSDLLIGGAGNDTFSGTIAEFNGDTIADFQAGDRIVFTNANAASFSFSLNGSTLTFSGGSLTFSAVPGGTIVASAVAGGGVQLTLTAGPVTPPADAGFAAGDFNGDGRDDILWRHESGALINWLGQANGGFVSNADANAGTDWHVVGLGDYNGDGRSDILWRNDSGATTSWLGQSNGSFTSNFGNAYYEVDASWNVAGTGDFNGDGRDDILWRHSSGQMINWLGQANGGFVSNADANAGTDWNVVSTGDFNGDGRDDILWRNNDGSVTSWLGQANGSYASNFENAYYEVDTSWTMAGTGDFNGDGRDDILWRHSSGQMINWLGQANGGFVSNADANAGTDWNIVSIGDFNGDGRDDILWRNDDGSLTNWLATANGSFASNFENAYYEVDHSWDVQPVSDYLI